MNAADRTAVSKVVLGLLDSEVFRDIAEALDRLDLAAVTAAAAMQETVPAAMRAQVRATLHQEMHGALARGDRKAYRLALSDLRSLDREAAR